MGEAVFRELPALAKVGEDWMNGCSSLATITIQGLPMLQEINHSFLYGCNSLKWARFEDLPALSKVGGRWMERCSSLETVTIQRLPMLQEINHSFLKDCHSLKYLYVYSTSMAAATALRRTDIHKDILRVLTIFEATTCQTESRGASD